MVAIAGCGSAGRKVKSYSASAMSNDISQAADVSETAKGVTIRETVRVAAGGQTEKIVIAGAYSLPQLRGSATFTEETNGKSITLQEVLDGPVVYVREPSTVAAKLPGGRPWLVLDLRKLKRNSALASLASTESSSWSNDPIAAIRYLNGESSSIVDLGRADVNGVPTTHFSAMLDLYKAGVGAPPSVRTALQRALSDLHGEITNAKTVPAQVWIDSGHLIRKVAMKLELTPPGTSEAIPVTVTLAVSSYGAVRAITLPPANETNDMLALLKSEGRTRALAGG